MNLSSKEDLSKSLFFTKILFTICILFLFFCNLKKQPFGLLHDHRFNTRYMCKSELTFSPLGPPGPTGPTGPGSPFLIKQKHKKNNL